MADDTPDIIGESEIERLSREKVAREAIKDVAEAQAAAYRALNMSYETIVKQAEKELAVREKLDELRAQERLIQAKQIEVDKLVGDARHAAAQTDLQDLEDQLKAIRKLHIERQLERDLQKEALNEGAALATRLTGVSAQANTTLGKIARAFMMSTAKGEDFFGTLIEGFKDTFSAANLAGSSMDKLVETFYAIVAINSQFAVSQDQIITGFNVATGNAGEYKQELRGLTESLLLSGVGAAESAKAFQSLWTNVTDFSKLTKETREELTQTVALLEKMGVSAEVSAKNIQTAMKGLGMTADEAAELQTKLLTVAQDLHLPAQQIAQDFGEAKNVLLANASAGVDVTKSFGQLEAQAKATGLSVSGLIAIAGKFDTFDSAAQQVGKLNAMLGGPFLSTLEMVSATDPAARVEMLSAALRDAGQSFDEMSYYEKKAIADAAGLSDVNDLALLMSDNMKLIETPEMDAKSIIEMKEEAAVFNDVIQEMKQVGMATVIAFGPLVDIFKMVANTLQTVIFPVFKALSWLVWGITLPFEGIAATIDYIASFAREWSKTFAAISLLLGGFLVMYGSLLAMKHQAWIIDQGILANMYREEALAKGKTIWQAVSNALSLKGLGIQQKGLLVSIRAGWAALGTAVSEMFAGASFMGPLGWGLAAVAAATLAGVASRYISMGDDVMMPAEGGSGYGKRTIMGPEGSIALNDNDTIIAGTNLGGSPGASDKLIKTSVVNISTENITQKTGGGAAPSPGPFAAAGGEIPPINLSVSLSIDGDEFKTVVNKVKVEPTRHGNLYNSIAKLVNSGEEMA